MSARSASAAAAAFLAISLLAGCSGDDDGTAGATSSTTGADRAPVPLAVGELDAPAAGSARVVLGNGLDLTLAVSSCAVDLAAEPEGEVPAELVAVRAEGETDAGTPVLLDVKRFRSAGAATTITDTVTVLQGSEDAPLDVAVAQRFEVGGQVTDGRDPDADAPLLQLRDGLIRARGVFAPPGAFAGDPGAVEGAVAVSCG